MLSTFKKKGIKIECQNNVWSGELQGIKYKGQVKKTLMKKIIGVITARESKNDDL